MQAIDTGNLTREQRVQQLVNFFGADRDDAQAVVDAEDAVNRGMRFETNAFAMQMARHDRLFYARREMENNIIRKGGKL